MSTDTEQVSLPSGVAARFVGQRMPRTEDQRMITGHGRYIDDLKKSGMVHATFVRSTVARGRILSVDVTEALSRAGAAAELVGVDTEPDEPVVTMPQALAEDAPRVHRELPSNLSGV